ncbi:MAG: hypothetical protein ACXADU_16520 [Promethearchaeota archaeon]|jgi:replication factor A1
MKAEAYINKKIQDMVEDKKTDLKGLISEEGALFIIARELGVDVKDENKDLLKEIEVSISDITSNMKNITIVGRIKDIYRVNKFNRSDGGEGYVGSFLLHDSTGDVRIVLWDEHVNIFKDTNFVNNEVIKIINGNARLGRFEEIEIHVGRFSKLELSPDDVDYNKHPKIKDELTSINKINLNHKSISVEGKIIQLSPIKEFTRKSGELGRLRSMNLLDSTGSIRLTFWNEDVDKINNLKVDDVISISNLNPKLNGLDSKTIDLNANRGSVVKKLTKTLQVKVDLVNNISMLQNHKGVASFKGKITSVDNLKKIESKSGEQISLLGFVVSDESDWIRVTLWAETADEYSDKLTVNQGLLLKNVIVRYSSFSQRNEITIIKDSILEFIDIEIKNPKIMDIGRAPQGASFSGNYKKIETINDSEIVEIKGFIVKDLNNITIYEACKKCSRKAENCNCDPKEETEFRTILNLIIDDGGGTIRTTFIGEKAEKLLGVKTDKLVQIKETPDFEKFLEKKSSEFLGKDIIIKGKAKFSDFSNSYEISVFDFKYLNVDEELERTLKKIET